MNQACIGASFLGRPTVNNRLHNLSFLKHDLVCEAARELRMATQSSVSHLTFLCLLPVPFSFAFTWFFSSCLQSPVYVLLPVTVCEPLDDVAVTATWSYTQMSKVVMSHSAAVAARPATLHLILLFSLWFCLLGAWMLWLMHAFLVYGTYLAQRWSRFFAHGQFLYHSQRHKH